jgi:hypothetical protein
MVKEKAKDNDIVIAKVGAGEVALHGIALCVFCGAVATTGNAS